ncbi:MAG: hypothetical protein KC656_29125, partial [Myxococcales bacterium]|nr:hypothetical protein [Myxococcales bacterium]
LGFLAFGAVAGGLYGALSRFAANRAFRRHMHAATDAPLASVLQAASAAAREGWMGRLLASLTVASVVGLVAAWIVLALGVAFG